MPLLYLFKGLFGIGQDTQKIENKTDETKDTDNAEKSEQDFNDVK